MRFVKKGADVLPQQWCASPTKLKLRHLVSFPKEFHKALKRTGKTASFAVIPRDFYNDKDNDDMQKNSTVVIVVLVNSARS